MHCVFVVQASEKIGLGHLLRCLGLSQQLANLGHTATFLLDDETLHYANAREDWQGIKTPVKYECLDNFLEQYKLDRSVDVDWLIVDGYQFSADFIQRLKSMNYRVVLFEDSAEVPSTDADIVINSSIHGLDSPQIFGNTTLLSGDQYRLMRQDFHDILVTPIEQRRRLTLCFGGSDPARLTLPMLEAIEHVSPIKTVTAITGPGFTQMAELATFLKHTTLDVDVLQNVQEMAPIWLDTRLAVSAAGGSQFELAACATPSVLVVVADNQVASSENAAKEGWAKVHYFDSKKREGINSIINDITRLWQNPKQISTMHELVRGKYDGLGAKRIVEYMLSTS